MKIAPKFSLMLSGKTQLHCPGIGRNVVDWAFVSVSAQKYDECRWPKTGLVTLIVF